MLSEQRSRLSLDLCLSLSTMAVYQVLASILGVRGVCLFGRVRTRSFAGPGQARRVFDEPQEELFRGRKG